MTRLKQGAALAALSAVALVGVIGVVSLGSSDSPPEPRTVTRVVPGPTKTVTVQPEPVQTPKPKVITKEVLPSWCIPAT